MLACEDHTCGRRQGGHSPGPPAQRRGPQRHRHRHQQGPGGADRPGLRRAGGGGQRLVHRHPVRGGHRGQRRLYRHHRLGRAEPAVLHVCQKGGQPPHHRPGAQPVLQPRAGLYPPADRHLGHHQPRDERRDGDLAAAALPRGVQDRHLCGGAGPADQVCPDPGPRSGRDAHPRHPRPDGVRHPGLRGGAGQDRHHPGRQLCAAQRGPCHLFGHAGQGPAVLYPAGHPGGPGQKRHDRGRRGHRLLSEPVPAGEQDQGADHRAGPGPLRLSGRGAARRPDPVRGRLQPQFPAQRGAGLGRGLCGPDQHGRGEHPAVPVCQQPLGRQAGDQDQPAGV